MRSSFGSLLAWVLSAWSAREQRLALVVDATTLDQLFTVLAVSVVYRECAIPVAWVILTANTPGTWRTHWLALLEQLYSSVPSGWTVVVLADRGLYAAWLYRQIVHLGWYPYLRINSGGSFRPLGQATFHPLTTVLPSVGATWSGSVTCFKRCSLACTLLATWIVLHTEPGLIITDLPPHRPMSAGTACALD